MCRCCQHACSLGICGVCRSSPTGAGAAATEAKRGNAWNTLSLARASATASGNASIAGWAGAAAGIAPVQVTKGDMLLHALGAEEQCLILSTGSATQAGLHQQRLPDMLSDSDQAASMAQLSSSSVCRVVMRLPCNTVNRRPGSGTW